MSPRGLVVMLVRMVEEFYFINLFINIAVDLLLCVVMIINNKRVVNKYKKFDVVSDSHN